MNHQTEECLYMYVYLNLTSSYYTTELFIVAEWVVYSFFTDLHQCNVYIF